MTETKLENNRILDLMENISELKCELNTINDQLKKEREKVAELQEYNNKLFMKVTHKVDEKSKEDDFKDKAQKYLGIELNDRELERFREIQEDYGIHFK